MYASFTRGTPQRSPDRGRRGRRPCCWPARRRSRPARARPRTSRAGGRRPVQAAPSGAQRREATAALEHGGKPPRTRVKATAPTFQPLRRLGARWSANRAGYGGQGSPPPASVRPRTRRPTGLDKAWRVATITSRADTGGQTVRTGASVNESSSSAPPKAIPSDGRVRRFM